LTTEPGVILRHRLAGCGVHKAQIAELLETLAMIGQGRPRLGRPLRGVILDSQVHRCSTIGIQVLFAEPYNCNGGLTILKRLCTFQHG
jgi:hypothetical protein